VQRSIKIAHEYGGRLCDRSDLIAKLIVGYPSHGFVIDYKEAVEIFGKHVRWVNSNESIFEKLLLKMVRNEGDEDIIDALTVEEKVPEPEEHPTVDEPQDTGLGTIVGTVNTGNNVISGDVKDDGNSEIEIPLPLTSENFSDIAHKQTSENGNPV
jgi:hypothetical protein